MPTPPRAPALPLALLRSLLPFAEREEVLADLAAEFGERARGRGRWAAHRWLWGQVLGSLPALVRRSWWRGWSGFEPRANATRPGGPLMERLILELRYAIRRLRMRPLYAMLAVLTLALGVAGTAAIFGIVRALLVDPLPYRSERDLVLFWNPYDWNAQEFTTLRGLEPRWPGFAGVAAYRPEDVTLEINEAPTRLLPGMAVSSELFDVLGVAPLIGRGFQAGDDSPNVGPTAVLSYELWRDLGADRTIIGKPLRLDGVARTVVGVMPKGFWFPEPTTRVWVRAALNPQSRSGQYALVGRVASGQDSRRMDAPVAGVTRELAARYRYSPQWDKTKNARVTPLREALVGSMRPALLATLAAMAVILLIACANVAALMLGQVESRSTELAVRSALGADRGRLATQLVFEALGVGLLAGVLGAGLSVAGFSVLRGALSLGSWGERATIDWTLFAAAIAVAIGGALLVAFLPTLTVWRRDLRTALNGARTGGILERRGGVQGVLVVAEVALAVVLATSAALLVRSVSNLYSLRPGIETRGIAVIDVAFPAGMNAVDRGQALRTVVAELGALPGAHSAAATHKLPLRGPGSSFGIQLPGSPEGPAPTTYFRFVTPRYFETLGIPLRQGRTFDGTERALDSTTTEVPVIVNEALVKKYFPNRNPLGLTITGGFGLNERIIGIVGDAVEAKLTSGPEPARYFAADQVPFNLDGQTLVVRTVRQGDAARILDAATRAIRRTAPTVAIQEATTMERVLDRAVGPARQVMSLLALLTGLALVLSAIGIYGVIAHYVSRRKRDWSIRIALGLPPARVVRRVVGHSSALVAAGIVLGAIGALALARLLGSLLFGVRPADPISLVGSAIVLLSVGALAALIPALRASRTDPALVLREQ